MNEALVDRPVYSITLEDLGDCVAWAVEDFGSNTAAAEGKVPLADFAGQPLELQLKLAFATAYAAAEVERQRLFEHDLAVAAKVAEEERAYFEQADAQEEDDRREQEEADDRQAEHLEGGDQS